MVLAGSPVLSRRALLRAATALGAVLGVGTLSGCLGDRPPPSGPLRLATGPPGAVYREFGNALTAIWNDAWGSSVVEAVPTEASLDNLDLLRDGGVDIGLLNVDVGADHPLELAALARVFDSVTHVLVPRDSPIDSFADLDGARVSLGLPGSGTRFTAERLLAAGGISVEVVSLSQADGAAALAAGEIDALVSLTAMPTPAITWLLEQPGAAYRFVGLGEEVSELYRRHPGQYLDVTISTAVYPEAGRADTIAVPTLLAVRTDFEPDLARFLTSATIEGAGALSQVRPEAMQINSRTAVATAPMTLHPASAEWFRSTKP